MGITTAAIVARSVESVAAVTTGVLSAGLHYLRLEQVPPLVVALGSC